MSGALEQFQAGHVSVAWLQDPTTVAYNGVLGAEKDRLVDRTKAGVKMRWPSGPQMTTVAQSVGATLDSTAGDTRRLTLIGGGFDLPRLGSMGDGQYQDYLESAWSIHQLGGTVASIVNALHSFGIVDADVFEEWEYRIYCGGFNQHRIAIVLGPKYGALGWTVCKLGACKVGAKLGIAGITSGQVSDLKSIVRRWKDAGALPMAFVFNFGASLLGTGTKLGTCKLGASGVARVAYGEACALGKVQLGGMKLGNRYY